MSETVTLREITPDNEAAVRALAAVYGQGLFAPAREAARPSLQVSLRRPGAQASERIRNREPPRKRRRAVAITEITCVK